MTTMRQFVGEVLRARRLAAGLTLRDVSAKARVSLGYISEIERGQKEPSSELLAALTTALDVPLSQVLLDVSTLLAIEEGTELASHFEHRARHAECPAGDQSRPPDAPSTHAPQRTLGTTRPPSRPRLRPASGLTRRCCAVSAAARSRRHWPQGRIPRLVWRAVHTALELPPRDR